MSRTISNLLYTAVQGLTLPMSARQRGKTMARLQERLREGGQKRITTPYGDILLLAGRGPHVASAAARFFEDEPETLHHIDTNIVPGETLWDIGANIGLYSLYAAKRGVEVFSFEPSGFNFSLLIDHIYLNAVGEKARPFCLAFSDADGIATLNMTEVSIGHASNALGKAANQFRDYVPAFTQSVPALRVDRFCEIFGKSPDHIKLDVDGLEPQILAGAQDTLRRVKTLLIEVEGRNARRDEALLALIHGAGLVEDERFRGLSAHGRNRLFVRA